MADRHKPRLLFYFLHLLGVGHVYRAKRLIEGFAEAGIAVDVIYGGDPIGAEFEAESIHYLPPIRAADASYATYLDANDEPLADPFMGNRQAKLLEIFDTLRPDLILIEAYPFGRRMVRHELNALLEEAAHRDQAPLVVSSVRDILQERKKAGRVEESRDQIKKHFDHVLIHSDPSIIRLDATYPLTSEFADKLSYTGFVVAPAVVADNIQTFDAIATVGGGGFGFEMLKCVLESIPLSPLADAEWCLATGPHMSPENTDWLASNAPDNVTVIERLDNLAAHLTRAKISISQCGYNTAMDALSAHREGDCRAVFVPYDTQGQSEQLRRAELLETAGYAINLPQSQLSPKLLGDAISQAVALPQVDHAIDFDGVKNTATIVRNWLNERPPK